MDLYTNFISILQQAWLALCFECVSLGLTHLCFSRTCLYLGSDTSLHVREHERTLGSRNGPDGMEFIHID